MPIMTFIVIPMYPYIENSP